jgi:hypothetical protein
MNFGRSVGLREGTVISFTIAPMRVTDGRRAIVGVALS